MAKGHAEGTGNNKDGGRTGLRRPAAWPPSTGDDDVKDPRTSEQRVAALEARVVAGSEPVSYIEWGRP